MKPKNRTKKAVVIPVKGDAYEITLVMSDTDNYPALVEHVGGYIELLPTMFSELTMYGDEHGKQKHLDFNARASVLAATMISPTDYIAGPVVILGAVNGQGDCAGIPEEFRAKLLAWKVGTKVRLR